MSAPDKRGPTGILVVDKPVGPTSHDVVAWARRALGTRTVGHAGTLDPFASGVLVVLVGEATKLSGHATDQDKRYRATLALGSETDTLDREGAVVSEAAVPTLDVARAQAALDGFVGAQRQIPPAYSALKKDGVALHERARRGEVVTPEARSVVLHEARVSDVEGGVTFEILAGKGYYVRSLGRDLARALGTVGHLSALRRLTSGRYAIEDALDGEVLARAARGDQLAQAAVRAALRPITPEHIPLPSLHVEAEGALALRQGKRPATAAAPGTYVAFEAETPVAIVEVEAGTLRVLRGFA